MFKKEQCIVFSGFILYLYSFYRTSHSNQTLVRYRTPTVRFRTLLCLCLPLEPNANKAYSIGITVGKHKVWRIVYYRKIPDFIRERPFYCPLANSVFFLI
jgi:hypothetical protein